MGDFPGSPGVKTSFSNAEVWGVQYQVRPKIPHALWPKRKKKTVHKTEANWNKFNKDFKNDPQTNLNYYAYLIIFKNFHLLEMEEALKIL